MLKSEKGIVLLESLPLTIIFVVLFCFLLGFVGVIHTGSLMSIGAYRHAFHLFNYRANLTYHVDFYRRNIDTGTRAYEFHYPSYRYHYVTSNTSKAREDVFTGEGMQPRGRWYRYGKLKGDPGSGPIVHEKIYDNTKAILDDAGIDRLNAIWLKIGYGICLGLDEDPNSKCSI